MHKPYLIALAALLAGSCIASSQADDPVVKANAALVDGSIIRGELAAKNITGATLFAEQLTLNPAIVKSITRTEANGKAKVELTNGDKFAMAIANEAFLVKSLLGDLNVPLGCLRTLTLSTRKASDDGLVFHCTFDDAASITSPAVGPRGLFQGGKFTAGKNGAALYVPAHTSCAKFTLPAGTLGPAGTIEFWAKADEGPFSNGGCPRFFEILAHGAAGEISQDWNTNNGNGGCGLTFRINGLPEMATSKITSSRYRFTTTPAGWHHYVLVWDTKGIDMPGTPSAVVFFDGEIALTTPHTTKWQGPAKLFGESTLFFPSREDEMPDYAKRAYTIDDFKVWNYAKLPDEATLQR